MLFVAQALQHVVDAVQPLAAVRLPARDCRGLVLAEDVISSGDSPPFDKAMMDGYALRSAETLDSGREWRVIGEITAGMASIPAVPPGEAVRIMTGATLPADVDAVVPFEHTLGDRASATVRLDREPLKPGENVMRRGAVLRGGDRLLSAGRLIRAQEIALLLEQGCTPVAVHPRPTLAVLATGNELVDAETQPGPGQIRNSNEPMLAALGTRDGCTARPLGIARDDADSLRNKIREGLAADVLCLSGGVSAGTLDLVPGVLRELGVRQVFHKVDLKPGKPVWFGVYERAEGTVIHRCAVFGLPGNPVSTMVCFELFVRTALRRLGGVPDAAPRTVSAALTRDHDQPDPRPTFYPARLETGGEWRVTPVDWKGSSDLRSTAEANAMIHFAGGPATYAAGTRVDVYPW